LKNFNTFVFETNKLTIVLYAEEWYAEATIIEEIMKIYQHIVMIYYYPFMFHDTSVCSCTYIWII